MYVFIGLHSLLPEAATRVEVFCKKKVLLKIFVNFIRKYLYWSHFLIKLQAWHLFWRTSARLFLHCTHTPFTVTYPFYFIFSTFFFIITVTTQKQSTGGVLQKWMFLEIIQNWQENTCVRVSFLIKLQGLGLQLF